MGGQLRANPENKLVLMVFQMTIAITGRPYLTGMKITIYIKQFDAADTFGGMWQLLFLEIKLTLYDESNGTSCNLNMLHAMSRSHAKHTPVC